MLGDDLGLLSVWQGADHGGGGGKQRRAKARAPLPGDRPGQAPKLTFEPPMP